MHKARKLTMFMFSLVLVATVFAGCSKSGSPASTTATTPAGTQATDTPAVDSKAQKIITWWLPNWDEAVAKEIVKKFEAKNPDIKVEMVITTWETMENKIRLALMGNNAPDLITELESRVKIYAAQNLLTELDPLIGQGIDKKDFIASALEINSVNGKIYGLPFRHDGSGMIYNKKMFRDAGLNPDQFPKTWDEFLKAAPLLTKGNNQYATAWPFGNQGNAVTRYLISLYSHGGEILSADEKTATLNTPQAVEAMRKLTDTIKMGFAPKSSMELDNTTLRGLFVNEKIAAFIDGQYDIEEIKKENPKIEIGTAVMPGPDGMGTTTVNGFSVMIPKSVKNKNEAWKLAEFIAQPENMSQLTNTFPGRISVLAMDKFNSDLLKPFAKQLEKGHAEPSYKNWPQMEKIIYSQMQLVILNGLDVQKAMNTVTEQINAIMK